MFTGAKRGGLIKGNALLLDNEGPYVMISLKENDSPNLFTNFRLFERTFYYITDTFIYYISYSITNK